MKDEVKKVVFYSMLYIKPNNKGLNMAENGRNNLAGYIRCCELLNNSLHLMGYSLVILTNNEKEIRHFSSILVVQEILFDLDVPEGIKFYSAHYKIDVFRYLSTKEEYSILIDSDVVCINEMPLAMNHLIDLGIPMYYDITNQCYPAYGRERLIKDKSLLLKKKSLGNWAGGELIGGNAYFYGQIYKSCMTYWEEYKNIYSLLHHQGDEILVSCAIEEYQMGSETIYDIGTVGGITRYWSVNIRHIQKEFTSVKDNFLVHLPADKGFLASFEYTSSIVFIQKYQKHIFYKNIINWFKNVIRKVLK